MSHLHNIHSTSGRTPNSQWDIHTWGKECSAKIIFVWKTKQLRTNVGIDHSEGNAKTSSLYEITTFDKTLNKPTKRKHSHKECQTQRYLRKITI